jgi:hypothetical protein
MNSRELPPVPSRESGSPLLLSSALRSIPSRASLLGEQAFDPADKRRSGSLSETPRRALLASSGGS